MAVMPRAPGRFSTTTPGLPGRYLPMKRATRRAEVSVLPPAVLPVMIVTVLPANVGSPAARAPGGHASDARPRMAEKMNASPRLPMVASGQSVFLRSGIVWGRPLDGPLD